MTSNQNEIEHAPPAWVGFGSFAFVVYVVVAVTYALAQTAYAVADDSAGAATYSVVEVPLLVALLLGLLAARRTPTGDRPPLLGLALGTLVGYLVYLGVLAAVALPVFGFVTVLGAPRASAVAGAGIALTGVLAAWFAHRFEFADERRVEPADGQRRR